MKEPAHIKGVLPPSFTAWYQLYKRSVGAFKRYPDSKEIVWTERHPTAGLSQGYEFTIDEIKARTFDELIDGVGNLLRSLEEARKYTGAVDREHLVKEELVRFLKYRYFEINP